MGEPLVHLDIADEVARVRLDKPPVNALDLEIIEQLADVVRELRGSGVRAAVFSGEGPSLAAGGDIKWMYSKTVARDRASLSRFFPTIQAAFGDIDRLPMPTIGVVHGMTLGGGFELALACDLRIAADDATVGFPEATLGLLPGAGGTQRLTEIVGHPRAFELLYTGRTLSAGEAHALGLVNRVAPAASLEDAVEGLLAEVLRSSRAAAEWIKRCVRANLEDGRGAGMRTEALGIEALVFDDDAVDRLTAFVERRARA